MSSRFLPELRLEVFLNSGNLSPQKALSAVLLSVEEPVVVFEWLFELRRSANGGVGDREQAGTAAPPAASP